GVCVLLASRRVRPAQGISASPVQQPVASLSLFLPFGTLQNAGAHQEMPRLFLGTPTRRAAVAGLHRPLVPVVCGDRRASARPPKALWRPRWGAAAAPGAHREETVELVQPCWPPAAQPLSSASLRAQTEFPGDRSHTCGSDENRV